jgi:hypothetical protein
MKYRRGMRSHAKILLGAIYEKSASFFTIEIVLMANRYWCSSLAFLATSMNELVKTVIKIVTTRK